MNKGPQGDSSSGAVEPRPRRSNRALLVASALSLGVWGIILLLVALRAL